MKVINLIAVLLLPSSWAVSDERLVWLTENQQTTGEQQTETASAESDSNGEQDLDDYIGELESELNDMEKNEASATSGSSSSRRSDAVRQLTEDAKSALQSSSKESLQSEFSQGGANLSDARAELYLASLLQTLNSQN